MWALATTLRKVLERWLDLTAEVEDLDLKERDLDQQESWLPQSIRNVMMTPSTAGFPT